MPDDSFKFINVPVGFMKTIKDFTVVAVDSVCKDCVELKLKANPGDTIPEVCPGQFVNILVPDNSVLLRRPISVHDFCSENCTLHLLVQKAGPGTESLAKVLPGDKLNVVLPLGNTFPLEEINRKKVLLVGGGVGVAPLYYYGKYLKQR